MGKKKCDLKRTNDETPKSPARRDIPLKKKLRQSSKGAGPSGQGLPPLKYNVTSSVV